MKIPFTLGIRKVSIFKLSKGSQRVGQWEGSQMDEGPGKEKKEHQSKFTESKSEGCLQLILKESFNPAKRLGVL